MGETKKRGRPTDNPKIAILKVGLDKTSVEKLEECAETMAVKKAEVVRQGIAKMHADLKKLKK